MLVKHNDSANMCFSVVWVKKKKKKKNPDLLGKKKKKKKNLDLPTHLFPDMLQ